MTKSKDRSGGPSALFDFESPMAIEMRRIMIRIGRQADLERKRSFMITSAQRAEGKSLFSLHFSLVLAYHLPARILLLDADVRRPVQHTVFQLDLEPGFANVLAGDNTLQGAVRTTKVKNLDIMPAGTCRGPVSRLFSANKVRELVNDLHKIYDIVLLDSPPVVPVSDPLHFIDAVDGCLFLVMAGQTHRDIAKRGIGILQSAGAKILGVVANNLGEVLPYYYDRKYYGYEGGRRKSRR